MLVISNRLNERHGDTHGGIGGPRHRRLRLRGVGMNVRGLPPVDFGSILGGTLVFVIAALLMDLAAHARY